MKARLSSGGRIDRSRTLRFEFNGRQYTGHPGDTLASALLAHEQRLVARSFKLHRPRGILSAGVEEPNALVQLFDGAREIPNARMTEVALFDGLRARSVNAYPGVGFDLRASAGLFARLLPAGFYYKTFMASQRVWHAFEPHIRAAGGLGKAPAEPDPDRYDKRHAHCDVLIVGAGIAGLCAALGAGATGARVMLCDEAQEPGGWLLSSDQTIDGVAATQWLADALERLRAMPEVTVLARTTAFGFHDHGLVTLLERRGDHLPPDQRPAFRERLWKVRARRVVLATGAHERPIVFAHNDLPGIMLAGAVTTYIRRYAVLPGRNALVFTNNDAGMGAALALAEAGARVRVVDARAKPDGSLSEQARERGIEILAGHVITEAVGARAVRRVRIAAIDAQGRLSGGERLLPCDLIAVSGGFSPVLHLHAQAGSRAQWRDDLASFVPGSPAQDEISAGACAGTRTLRDAALEGTQAGAQAAREACVASPAQRPDATGSTSAALAQDTAAPVLTPADPGTLRPLWLVAHPRGPSRAPKQFVDLQNDVSAGDLLLALREGFESIEHVKRYTAMGFGTDQGKTGNINGMGIVAQTLGRPIAEVGTTTFRPNYTPVSFGAVAGIELGDAFDPVRTTALHDWHVRHGACFEDVGQWKRPWFYPRAGEDMAGAVRREIMAVRNGVGMLDASTLGKIDIQGPDASTLLNWVYCNGWSQLAIGRARYGLMLDENGMVFDDGVTVRLAEHLYLMHTTTGGAARVLAWLERWLQTEWPQLRVYLSSVTDHWATIAVAGPDSRSLLRRAGTDIDLADDAFPFMAYRPGRVAGVPARVFRISFSGERCYEVNVPAGEAERVWQALFDAGEALNVTPYGTEAMHVLRAEKGFVIVGQDTDGSVTPVDLGMAGMVSRTKDFLGRRSLSRLDTARSDRKQLVGLLSQDPARLLAEGGQILESATAMPPATMIGHVTSSYHNPALGRSIALALIRGGRERHGDTVWVSAGPGAALAAVITSPVFYDPEGERQHHASPDETAGATSRNGRDATTRANAGEHAYPGSTDTPGLHAQWRHALTLFSLRGDADDPRFRDALADAGIPLPAQANTTLVHDRLRIVWAGPDEWLILADPASRDGLGARLRDGLQDLHHALTDVSDGYALLCLSGEQAGDVLAHGCPLDLHPREFHAGMCAGSHYFKAQIRLWRTDDEPGWQMLVRRSFVGYVDLLLRRSIAL